MINVAGNVIASFLKKPFLTQDKITRKKGEKQNLIYPVA